MHASKLSLLHLAGKYLSIYTMPSLTYANSGKNCQQFPSRPEAG